MATRERSLHGGNVFVVRSEVIERLGVEASAVELKPSPAEVAAAAAAAAAATAAASVADGGDVGCGEGGVTTPGSGEQVRLSGWVGTVWFWWG